MVISTTSLAYGWQFLVLLDYNIMGEGLSYSKFHQEDVL